jgi:hypothetical protein
LPIFFTSEQILKSAKIKLASTNETGRLRRTPPKKTSSQNPQQNPMSTSDIESNEYKKQLLHEATRLAIESVKKAGEDRSER